MENEIMNLYDGITILEIFMKEERKIINMQNEFK